jgi:RNA polymerase sigma-70 factor (ECF subfamily)
VEAYERYYTKVFAYVYSRVGNVEVTKDLTAEVFEKAYVKGHSVREAAAYATWLFMIAKNVVVGHYRRHKREIDGMSKMKESLWLKGGPSSPEDDALRGETASNLMSHVRRLSRRDQELLALKFEGELSYAEISRVLNISEVNVRVSLFRALKRLRNLIKEAQ